MPDVSWLDIHGDSFGVLAFLFKGEVEGGDDFGMVDSIGIEVSCHTGYGYGEVEGIDKSGFLAVFDAIEIGEDVLDGG